MFLDGPQLRIILIDQNFIDVMNRKETAVQTSFKNVVENCLVTIKVKLQENSSWSGENLQEAWLFDEPEVALLGFSHLLFSNEFGGLIKKNDKRTIYQIIKEQYINNNIIYPNFYHFFKLEMFISSGGQDVFFVCLCNPHALFSPFPQNLLESSRYC